MKRQWTRWLLVITALALCAGARAASTRYEAALQADGKTLGTATGALSVSRAPDGRVAWSLTDGTFTAAAIPHATVVFDPANLAGSGVAAANGALNLKEFNVTVAQSTGVDLTYRFRFVATLKDDAVVGVEIRQLK